MSASSKKKLRNEQNAAKLTERQLAEQKEAKKLKIYTISFVVVLVALLVTAVTVGVIQTIGNSGMREKNTVALTIGNKTLSNTDLNYFFTDAVNNFYSNNSTYLDLIGIDSTLPLDEQIYDESTGDTWADYFMDNAKKNAVSAYTLAEAATAAGHTMTEDELSYMESTISNQAMYATLYGYPDMDTFLKQMYGNGADEESFRSYIETTLLADSYYAAYQAGLTYEDADFRAAEAENYNKYSSFSYNYHYFSTTKYQQGGTTDENGVTTYTEEEKASFLAAAKADAEALAAGTYASVEELDAAIAALPVNAGSENTVKTIPYSNQNYTSIDADIAKWLSDEARQEGDVACIENLTSTTDENGNVTEIVSGYYLLYFIEANDNAFALKNVRHILVKFEGGTTDANGYTTYTDEEKKATKDAAEEILNQWKFGDATEESFAALATEKSADTGSTANGGLYENVYPGQMVSAFDNWTFGADRKAGDTDIVESEYGYHVMYFSGDSDLTYRDYQIRNELLSADLAEWQTNLETAAAVTDGNISYIKTDLILGN